MLGNDDAMVPFLTHRRRRRGSQTDGLPCRRSTFRLYGGGYSNRLAAAKLRKRALMARLLPTRSLRSGAPRGIRLPAGSASPAKRLKDFLLPAHESTSTYAEAFRSIYAFAVLICPLARDRTPAPTAPCTHSTGKREQCHSSAIARPGLWTGTSPATERRPTAGPRHIVQFHVPRFWKDREARLERDQCWCGSVKTSSPARPPRCFNRAPRRREVVCPLGRKLAALLRRRSTSVQRRTLPAMAGAGRSQFSPANSSSKACYWLRRRPDGRKPLVLRLNARCRPCRRGESRRCRE